jgi:hypothetical protein
VAAILGGFPFSQGHFDDLPPFPNPSLGRVQYRATILATTARHPLKIDAQKPIERALKGLLLGLTHWVVGCRTVTPARFTREHSQRTPATPL